MPRSMHRNVTGVSLILFLTSVLGASGCVQYGEVLESRKNGSGITAKGNYIERVDVDQKSNPSIGQSPFQKRDIVFDKSAHQSYSAGDPRQSSIQQAIWATDEPFQKPKVTTVAYRQPIQQVDRATSEAKQQPIQQADWGSQGHRNKPIAAVFEHKTSNEVYPQSPPIPFEQEKMILPPYVISPPDVLQINSVNLLPKATHPIRPLDVVSVQFPVKELHPDDMQALVKSGLIIDTNFQVELDGTISLGAPYNRIIRVANLSQEQAGLALTREMEKVVNPKLVKQGVVKARLIKASGLQAVQGPHLVRLDGTIGLGIYGGVHVTGLTLEQAKARIELQLSQYLQTPKISLDVIGFNSQVYYVIFDGGGLGEQVVRLPVTGNETVLDAIGQVNGLPSMASRSHVWIARPGPGGQSATILPVDWRDITQRGITKTNFQLLAGDRLYVKADPLITVYTYIDRFISPIERVMGGILLGSSTYRSLRFVNDRNAGTGSGF